MYALPLIEVDDSLGLILPDEVLDRLKVGLGDTLYVSKTAHGLLLSTYDPESEAQEPEHSLHAPQPQNKK